MPPRLRWIFANNPVFFVTCCTYRRRKLLASDPVHTAFLSFATHAYSQHNIAVGCYVIMPDHLHLFVCGPDDFALGRWVAMLKQHLGKQIQGERSTSPIWQRGFSIIFCATMKVTRKMEARSARTLFAPDW